MPPGTEHAEEAVLHSDAGVRVRDGAHHGPRGDLQGDQLGLTVLSGCDGDDFVQLLRQRIDDIGESAVREIHERRQRLKHFRFLVLCYIF